MRVDMAGQIAVHAGVAALAPPQVMRDAWAERRVNIVKNTKSRSLQLKALTGTQHHMTPHP